MEAAIELMNAHGNVVGTTQIAGHLGISPGNLYYHFGSMQEIVGQVLVRLRKELAETLALQPSEVVSEERLVGYYSGGAMVLWRYRFLVSSSLELTGGDPELARAYRDFTAASLDSIHRIVRNVVKHHPGKIHVAPRDCARLAESMWVLWNGWPRHAEHYRRDARVSPAAIAHGFELIAMVLAPYVDDGFHRKVKRGLERFVEGLKQQP